MGGRVCEGRAGATNTWPLPISGNFGSQSSSYRFREPDCFTVTHCRTLIVFFMYLFWCVCVCVPVPPDRRTNPFGETDDECSTENDGERPLLVKATLMGPLLLPRVCNPAACLQRRQAWRAHVTFACFSVDSLLQQVFAVRFLGSMAVRCGKNQEVIYEAMRQVLAARAIHNIFRTTESHLMVTSSDLRYL